MQKEIINFVKRELNRQNMTQAQFAKDSNIAERTLSRILSKKDTTNKNLINMLDALDHSYSDILCYYEKMPRLLDAFCVSVFELNDSSSKELYTEIQKFLEQFSFLKSKLFETEFKIVDTIYRYRFVSLTVNIKEFLSLKNSVEKKNPRWQAIYYDYLGLFYCDQRQFSDAFKNYQKALSLDPPSDVSSMVNYHLSRLYEMIGYHDLSLISSMQALYQFRSVNNLKRSLSCELHIANVHARNNHFSLARSQYLSILQKSKQINYRYLEKTCYSNLCYLSNKAKNYQDTLKYLQFLKAYPEFLDKEDTLRELLALMELKKNEEFELLYKHAFHTFEQNTPQYSELIIYRYHFDHNKEEQYFEHLKSHIKTYRDTDDQERLLEIYDLIIDYFKQQNNYKNLSKYSLEKNELLSLTSDKYRIEKLF